MVMSCVDCRADLEDEATTAGAGVHEGQQVHLHSYGPRHDQVMAHPVFTTTAPFGVPYRPPAAAVAPVAWLPPSARTGPRRLAGVITWTDVSEWQGAHYDDTYPWPVASYRVSLGTTYTDLKVGPNSAWCHGAVGGNKLAAHLPYHVWYPGGEAQQAARYFTILGGNLDNAVVGMIDVESWSGQITGDHSAQITALADAMAAKLGSTDRVKIYGNSGDLASIAPGVPAKYRRIKAGYSSQPPPEPWDGWQYSDGATQWPVPTSWTRSSAPFGACDHNAFLGTLAQFLTAYGIGAGDAPMSAAEVQTITTAITNAQNAIIKAIGEAVQTLIQAIGEPTHTGTPSLRNHVSSIATIQAISLLDAIFNGHLGSPSVLTADHLKSMGITAGAGLAQKVDGVGQALPTADALAAALGPKLPAPPPISDAQVQTLATEVAAKAPAPPPYTGTFSPASAPPAPPQPTAGADEGPAQ